jgi:hypothetical protein
MNHSEQKKARDISNLWLVTVFHSMKCNSSMHREAGDGPRDGAVPDRLLLQLHAVQRAFAGEHLHQRSGRSASGARKGVRKRQEDLGLQESKNVYPNYK